MRILKKYNKVEMQNKGDFIIELLTSKNISTNDRERILKLSAKEFGKNSEELNLIKESIKELKEQVSPGDSNGGKNLPKYYRPYYLFKYLEDFNQNSILKSTCHEIDSNELVSIKRYCGFIDYDFDLHIDKILIEFNLHEKRNYYAPTYIKALIRGYLTGKNYFGEELVNGWSTDEIKINWSHFSVKTYTVENPKIPPNYSIRNLRILKTKPCKIEQFNSKINGNTVQTFRELVLHFKNLIHIKEDNSLKQILLNFNESNELNNHIDFFGLDDSFTTNIQLFTDVDKLIQAYEELIKLIQEKHLTNGKPQVRIGLSQYEKTIEFSIHHLNGIYEKNLQDTKDRPIGQVYENLINNQIAGMCNLYLRADFGNDVYAQFEIWSESASNGNFKFSEIPKFKGVEHILEFEKRK
jgi:hypothetical protein